ncbi:HD domain-containing phosphohydrolase [Desulfurivibrio sp. D14AmB]|uniref:HD domain-containing phosphohydrolase n=1 Tax=Desulfurivibrio sp. D14AmB TaxID=3374370 RepID=UPI00376EDD6B
MTEPAGGCVLFVDDEENILRALRRLCMEESFTVHTASSGSEALAMLADLDDLAVIVSDQRMPEMSGVEMLEQARQQHPLAIRILLTGYADIGAAMDSINRGGVYRYITKPWQDEDLLQTLRGAVQHYQLVKENIRLNALVKKQNLELQRWNSELEIMVQEQTMELQRNYDDLKKLNIRQRANFKAVITALAGLMEMRDKRMRSHAQDVAEIAFRVGGARKMSAMERETLVVAALLHDIGKIGMPDVLLLVDEAQMDAAELEEYHKHPIRGQAALDRIADLREVGEIIRHHHEHYDGGGFPDRLRHRQIPLAARIIAIIDFVDREVRRYQGDSGVSLTFKKVYEEAGRRFDPKLIAVVEQVARAFYRGRLPRADFVEMELHPKDLAAGMTLSRDVFSGTGILLLSKGSLLNENSIGLLRRYSQLDPGKRGVFVSLREGAEAAVD